MNLFIHILRDTTLPTVESDLVLLGMCIDSVLCGMWPSSTARPNRLTDFCSDIAFGYFSNLEFVTGLELSRLFVRDLCHYARLAVEHNQEIQDSSIQQTQNLETAHEISQAANLLPDSVDFDDTSTLPFYVSCLSAV